ncbi:alpha/beta hydrolase [Streptomyces longispororuber]|uniref:alpha/beta hydrolase n=1 Tax=Streptomyces longispororuber TaxID=68230 RepID=UPI00210C6438|nr:alpha/beta hydrolase [Streptomyces longispororuber]MCQ4207946.1 alpha/beta hydrolase [Streptomyces longispororuber]
MKDNRRRPEFLLVHGAWHGSWAWRELQDVLAGRGWTSHTVDLPSVVAEGAVGKLPGLLDDARAVREKIDAVQAPLIVVGHSYGGAPVTEATTAAANVSHLVYVSAFALDEGESLMTCFGGEQPDLATVEGTIPVRDDPEQTLYNDVPQGARDAALARLLPQSTLSFAEPVSRAGWKTLPSSYVLCDDDRSLAPSYQEPFALRTGTTYHLPSGHTPMLSMPEELADVLEEIASSVRAQDVWSTSPQVTAAGC